MSKAILIIDMPDYCSECILYRENNFGHDMCMASNERIFTSEKPDWCPLQSIPEKKHQPQYCGNGVFGYRTAMEHEYARGWNECIDYFIGK